MNSKIATTDSVTDSATDGAINSGTDRNPSPPVSRPAGVARRFFLAAFDDLLGVRAASPEERELIRRPAVAALRRFRSWILPVLYLAVAAFVLGLFWIRTANPWQSIDFLFGRIAAMEALIGIAVLLVASAAAKRRHTDPTFLQDLCLTPLAPRTVALSAVSATVAVWVVAMAALIPVEIAFIFYRLLARTFGGAIAFTPWLAIRSAVVAVVVGGLLGWFHLETIRFAAWSAAIQILPRIKKPTPEMRQDPLQTGSVIAFYGVLIALLSFPLVLLFVAAIFGVARLFGVEILLSDLHRLPEVQLFAWLGVAGFLVMVKRRMAETALDQFALRWLPMTWRGVAEPDGPSPPLLRLAILEWAQWHRARAVVDACRDGGRFARWRGRLACGRHRWLRAQRVHLDPESYAVAGWGQFRHAVVKPCDDLALEIPDIPLPYEPNPGRVFGTPTGGPSRLDSAAGSTVAPLDAGERPAPGKALSLALGIVLALLQLFQLAYIILGIFCLPGLLLFMLYMLFSPSRALSWGHAIALGAVAAGTIVFLLAVKGIRALLTSWMARRVQSRPGRLFDPASGDLLTLVEDARSYHLPKVRPDEMGLFRFAPGRLEIEGMSFRAQLRAEDIRMQIHETLQNRGLLLTVAFGDTLWGITLYGRDPVALSIPFLRDRSIRAFRDQALRPLQPQPHSDPLQRPR